MFIFEELGRSNNAIGKCDDEEVEIEEGSSTGNPNRQTESRPNRKPGQTIKPQKLRPIQKQ